MKQMNLGRKLLYFTTERGIYHWALSFNFELYIKYRKNIPSICFIGDKAEIEAAVQEYILNTKKESISFDS
jgi:hypothetical protein